MIRISLRSQVNVLNTWPASTLWSRTFFCLIDLFSSPFSFLPFLFFRLHPHFLFLVLLLILFLFPVLLLVSYPSSCPSFIFILFLSSHFHSLFIFISIYEPLLILRCFSPISSFPPVLLSFFPPIPRPISLPSTSPRTTFPYLWLFRLLKTKHSILEISSPRSDNTKIKVYWDVTPCSLVHRCQIYR